MDVRKNGVLLPFLFQRSGVGPEPEEWSDGAGPPVLVSAGGGIQGRGWSGVLRSEYVPYKSVSLWSQKHHIKLKISVDYILTQV